MSTRAFGIIVLVMTVLLAVSLLTGCTTTVPGRGTTTVHVSDDCRTNPADPPWWPLCARTTP